MLEEVTVLAKLYILYQNKIVSLQMEKESGVQDTSCLVIGWQDA